MQKGIIKNVNKLTGEAIDAKDLASMLSGIIGNESGVLTVFDELRLEKISDNKVRLHSGVYSLKGHILYIPKGSYEDFEIESGTLGANRIDLLVAEYVKNGEGDGEDTLQFKVIKGETASGQPQAPDLIKQDISANGITYQEQIHEILIQNEKVKIQNISNKIKNTQKLNLELSALSEIVAGQTEVTKTDNGTVVRFDNGIQFAFTNRAATLNILDEHGSLYRNATQHNWTFPKPFKGTPIGVVISNLNSRIIGGYVVNVNAHSTGYYFLSSHKQENSGVYVSIFAYGFWK